MTRRHARLLLEPACARWPNAMYAAAGIGARLTAWAGHGPSEESLRRLLPELTPRQAARARRESWAATLRTKVLEMALSVDAGPSPFPRLAAAPDPASLRPPLILATFHVGSPAALGALLERLPGEVFALQHSDWPAPAGIQMSVPGHGQGHRAARYWGALRTLRAGGFVFGAIDGAGASIDVDVLGRSRRFARGLPALARATGAAVLPVVGRWRGRKIEVITGTLVEPAEDEVMADELARWLEGVARAHPGALSPKLVDALVRGNDARG